MKLLHILLFALVSLATLSSGGCAANCTSCQRAQERNRRPLEGNAWHLHQINGRTLPMHDAPTELLFSEAEHTFRCTGRAAGLRGEWRQIEAEMELHFAVDQTSVVGEDPLRGELAEVLSATNVYAMDGDMLILMHDNRLLAVLQAVAN